MEKRDSLYLKTRNLLSHKNQEKKNIETKISNFIPFQDIDFPNSLSGLVESFPVLIINNMKILNIQAIRFIRKPWLSFKLEYFKSVSKAI